MKKVVLVIVALAVLVGAFFVFKPESSKNLTDTNQPATKTYSLVVKGRKLASGKDTIIVTQGDQVVIKITADEDEELHLHGYDVSVDLKKDKPAELRFTARLTGNFPLELEKSKTDLSAVQVQPK